MLPARDPHNDASTIDPEGLLAALVIAPGTYPRNRFFFLHKDPVVKRVRRRSAQLRGLVRYLMGGAGRVVVDARETHADGSETIRYRVEDLSLRAEVSLDPFERAVVDVALAIADAREPEPAALRRVNDAIERLAPRS